MKSEWKEIKFGDFIKIKRGHDLPKTKMNEGIYPVVGSNGIIGYHDEYTTKSPSLTVGRSGNIGKPFYLEKDTWSHNTTLYVEDFLGNDPYFVYNYLKIMKLNEFAGGSAVPTLNRNHINPILIKIPPKNIQIKISEILKNIDKKIELNNKINNNLEQLLNACFKKIQTFDKSSDDLKYTEEFGDIPKEWSVEYLIDYVEFLRGFEPGSDNYYEKNTDATNLIKFFRVGDLKNPDTPVFIKKELIEKSKTITEEDIVISLDATIGIVTMGLNGSYSSGMRKIILKTNQLNRAFVYTLLKTERVQNILKTYASGTTILHASKSLKFITFILPDDETMKRFIELTNPILYTILSNIKEIERLKKLRDILLPKLMSGEIDVSDINFDLN